MKIAWWIVWRMAYLCLHALLLTPCRCAFTPLLEAVWGSARSWVRRNQQRLKARAQYRGRAGVRGTPSSPGWQPFVRYLPLAERHRFRATYFLRQLIIINYKFKLKKSAFCWQSRWIKLYLKSAICLQKRVKRAWQKASNAILDPLCTPFVTLVFTL